MYCIYWYLTDIRQIPTQPTANPPLHPPVVTKKKNIFRQLKDITTLNSYTQGLKQEILLCLKCVRCYNKDER